MCGGLPEGQTEEIRYNILSAQFGKDGIVDAEIVGTRQTIGIGLDPGYQLAQDDAIAEDVAALVVVVALETFGTHPVGTADRAQFRLGRRIGDGGAEAEVADDGGESYVGAALQLSRFAYQDVLKISTKHTLPSSFVPEHIHENTHPISPSRF